MDFVTWTLALFAGCAVGVVTGLIPSLHVNTVAAVLLAALPTVGPAGAIALAAVAVVHLFVAVLPATYLGLPGEETAMSVLPAHRMTRDGEGPQAVRVALDASLAALLLVALFALPYKWLVAEPGRLAQTVEDLAIQLLAVVLAFLCLRGWRNGVSGIALGAIVVGLSGLLGWLGTGLTLRALVPVAATPLLPMLSGLFGGASLIESFRADVPLVEQVAVKDRLPRLVRRRVRRGIILGTMAAAATGLMPGMTSSVSVALARVGTRDDDPRPVLATLAAVGAAHTLLALIVLHIVLRSRSGLAVAVESLWGVERWETGTPPDALLWLLLTSLAAGVVGLLVAGALDRPFALHVTRIPTRPLAGSVLAVLAVLVLVLSGPLGVFLFVASAIVGLVPLALGIARIHLAGALLVPVLLFKLGHAAP